MKKTVAFFLLVFLILSMASCQEKAYQKGILTSTTYESEFLNLKFTAPEGVKLATEEEMKSTINQSTQLLKSESLNVDAAVDNSVIEMYAYYGDRNPNVILMTEKLQSRMTAEKYIETLKQQLAGIKTIQYEVTTGKGSATIAGQEYATLSATATYASISMTQEYYIRIQDGRVVSFIITFTSDTTDKKDALLSAFTEYGK